MQDSVNKYHKYIQTYYSKEFRFVISLLQKNEEKGLIDTGFNWQNFTELIAYHKLYPVLFQNNVLNNELIPDTIKSGLKKQYEEKTRTNLHLTANLIQLDELFQKNDIIRLWLKGPVLATELYHQLNQRLSGDIDILIPEKKLSVAQKILQLDGFTCELDLSKLSRVARRFFLKFRNQLHYYNRQKQVALELHWRLVNPNGLWRIGFNDLYLTSKEINIGNKKLRTLSNENYFLYLAVHGSLHQWFRLFWLRDIHEMIIQKRLDWDKLLSLAKRNKLSDVIVETCIISNLLFKTPLPEKINNQTLNKRTRIIIQKIIIRLRYTPSNSDSKGLNHLKVIYYMSQLKNDLLYKINCFLKLLVNSEELKRFNLPSILFPLYFFKRFLSWFKVQYISRDK